MLYSTVSAMYEKYKRLLDAGVNSATISRYLDEAGGEADSYLASRVTVPVSPAPAVLVAKVEALAYCTLLNRFLHEAGKESAVNTIREQVIAWLEGVRDGKLLLPGGAEAVVGIWSSTEGYTPTFGAGPIEDAVVDPDRVQDEEDARG